MYTCCAFWFLVVVTHRTLIIAIILTDSLLSMFDPSALLRHLHRVILLLTSVKCVHVYSSYRHNLN